MKILARDEKLKTLKIKVESEEDLWVLYNVVKKGDIVYARTSRELKTRSGSKRKGMVLGIRVEWCDFQPFTTRLRIHGIIVYGPKELDLEGQRHTLGIDIGSTITIIREDGWEGADLERLEEACRKISIPVLIVSLDDEEYGIGLVKGYGIQVIVEEYIRLPGKLDIESRSKAIETTLKKICNQIVGITSRYKLKVVIVAGPGYMKEYLYNTLKQDSRLVNIKIIMEHTSWGGVKGIHEVLKRGKLIEVLRDHDLVVEETLLEEFMYYIAKDPRYVAYGLEDVELALNANAVKKLMITNDMLRHPDEHIRRRVEELLKRAEAQGAEIKIFSTVHDTKIRLKNLGEIAAILRYPLDVEIRRKSLKEKS
mgnify:CR=1 FL=1